MGAFLCVKMWLYDPVIGTHAIFGLISEQFRRFQGKGGIMGVAVICRVGYYREYHGLTQRELAAQAGTGNSSIAEIESGKRLPNVLLAIRIARVLQMTVEELWEEKQ